MRFLLFSGVRRAAGLGLLAFAGAFAVPAVHAQSLNIDQGTATISGSGTVVTGLYTTFGGAGPATTSYNSVFSDFTGTLNLQPGGSIQTFTSSGGVATMSGGTVGTFNADAVYLGDGDFNNPQVSITGGSVNTLYSVGGYAYQPFGGYAAYDTVCNLSGGTFGTLVAQNYGGFNITGTNLKFANNFVTGTLASGQSLNVQYVNQDAHGFLEFNGIGVPAAAVPEASTTISLGLLLLLGLGGMVMAKRRTQTA